MKIRATSLAVKFLLTLFIARYMGFEVLGIYGVLSVACIVAPAFFGLSLMHVISRKAVTMPQEELVAHLRYYGRYLLGLYTVLFFAAYAFGVAEHNLNLVLVFFLILVLEHLNTDIYNLQLNLSQPLIANILHFIRSGFWMLIFMGTAFFNPELRTIEFLLQLWAYGSVIAFFAFVWNVRNWPWRARAMIGSWKTWFTSEFKVSRIMYMNTIAETTSSYLNLTLVGIFLGLELTGVYVFFMQIISALTNLVQTGVIQIARPKMVRAYKNKDSNYVGIYRKCMRDTFITTVGMVLVAIPSIYVVTVYIVEKPLAVAWYPAFLVMLCGFVVAMARFANTLVFYSQHRDGMILRFSLMSIVFGLLLNAVLMWHFHLWGVVMAGFMNTTTMLFLQGIAVKSVLKEYQPETTAQVQS